MKKNAQLHLVLETKLLDILRREAYEQNVPISEFCRMKLRENLKLDKIEKMLEKLLNKNGKANKIQ